MARGRNAVWLFAALVACSTAGNEAARAPTSAPELALVNPPAWLVPYGPEQRAFFEQKPQSELSDRALPVYPSLDHFAYSAPAPFAPEHARELARRIEEQIEASPRLYVFGKLDAKLANLVAQYGPEPPAEPDPWVRTRPAAGRDGRYELAWSRPVEGARTAVMRHNQALRDGDRALAEQELRQAIDLDPEAPGLWTAFAPLLASRGDAQGAEAALREALRVDPRSFEAELGLAELLFSRRARPEARHALARALALHPVSPRALALAARIAPMKPRPAPPRIFLEVGPSGAIFVGTPPDEPGRVYAGCRAALRFEPVLRESLAGLPAALPYHLSIAEERTCLEAMLGRYLERGAGTAPPDAGAADAGATAESSTGSSESAGLLAIAERGMLTEYAAFDVLGQRRPEWLRLAPDALMDSVVRYVEDCVLSP